MPERPRPIVGPDPALHHPTARAHCRHLGACRHVGILAVAPAGSAPRDLAWRGSGGGSRMPGAGTTVAPQSKEVPSS